MDYHEHLRGILRGEIVSSDVFMFDRPTITELIHEIVLYHDDDVGTTEPWGDALLDIITERGEPFEVPIGLVELMAERPNNFILRLVKNPLFRTDIWQSQYALQVSQTTLMLLTLAPKQVVYWEEAYRWATSLAYVDPNDPAVRIVGENFGVILGWEIKHPCWPGYRDAPLAELPEAICCTLHPWNRPPDNLLTLRGRLPVQLWGFVARINCDYGLYHGIAGRR